MATIAENLQTIKDSTAAIKQSIINKGGEIRGNITTWASAIDKIETGGGGEVVPTLEEKDVNFYDYDGTLLFAYTLEEAQALTELPTPKGHSGLVFDGWNWDYEDVIALDYPMDIGAMYRTDDGKTRLYLEVEDEDGVDIEFGFAQTANDVVVDFGDGSATQSSPNANAIIPHHYSKGSYVLRVWSKANSVYAFDQTEDSRNCLGGVADYSATILTRVEVGDNARVRSYAFSRCAALRTVTAPRMTAEFGGNSTFRCCLSLRHINIPKGTQNVIANELIYCTSLRSVTLPNSSIKLSNDVFSYTGLSRLRITPNTNLSNNTPLRFSGIKEFDFKNKSSSAGFFQGCNKLRKVENIEGCMINLNFFNSCYSLEEVAIPSDQTTMYQNSFYDCKSLRELVFPSGITTIQTSAFANSGIKIFDFRAVAIVPTLQNANAFNGTLKTSKIIVPNTLFDEWIAATNWSTYADRIVKASEYVETN